MEEETRLADEEFTTAASATPETIEDLRATRKGGCSQGLSFHHHISAHDWSVLTVQQLVEVIGLVVFLFGICIAYYR